MMQGAEEYARRLGCRGLSANIPMTLMHDQGSAEHIAGAVR